MKTLVQRLLVAGLAAFSLSIPSCTKAAPSEKPASPREKPAAHRNVVLIVIDTLRYDRLGCYGSELGATPRIDAFAKNAVLFEHAYSHAPWTLPSTASLLTSLYPPQHGAGGWLPRFHRLPERVRTVAECFRDAGYATAEVVNVDFLTKSFGMTQGFEYVDFKAYPSNLQVRPARLTTATAAKWLRARGPEPFFLMVHYFDPHLVYAPPAEFRRKFAAEQDRESDKWVFGTRRQIIAYRRGKIKFKPETIRRAERLYDAEVAYTDQEVGRLLDLLGELGLGDSTVVALTADHGEEFLDHGGFEHGHTLYNELVHVPLIIRNGSAARRVAQVVAHVDVAPTLCALAGVKADPAFVGRDLRGLIDGGTLPDRPIVFEGNFWGKPLLGWLKGGYKLIRRADKTVELYSLEQDPRELNDLAHTNADLAARMTADMALAFKRMAAGPAASNPGVSLTHQEMERLKALGYAGGNDDDDDGG